MTDGIPTPGARRPEPLSFLWRVFAAPQALMIVLGLFALAVILGTLVPQIPLSERGDPRAWLAAQPGLVARSNLLYALRLYDVFHSVWFRLLLGIAALVALVRMVDAAELAWRARGQTHWSTSSFRFWVAHRPPLDIACSLPASEAQDRIRHWLGRHRYRCAWVPDYPVPTYVACRGTWVLWARPVAYGASLASLIGLLALGTWGWQGKDWQPNPGESELVGAKEAYAVRLEEFDLGVDESDGGESARSTVSWLKGDTVLKQVVVRPGKPTRLQGLAVRQVGFVPSIKVRGWDQAGRPLILQTEEEEVGIPAEVGIAFTEPGSRPVLYLPRQDVFLAFSFEPPCAGGRSALRIDLLRTDGTGGRPLASLSESGSVAFDGIRLGFDLGYRPILRADYRPGVVPIVGGTILFLIALALSWCPSLRLAWISIGMDAGQGTTLVHLVARRDAGGNRWLPELAESLARELSDVG